MAVRTGAEATIRLLLDRGADIDAREDGDETVLYYASTAYIGSALVKLTVTLLLEHHMHVDINAKNRSGQTPLLEVLEHYDRRPL
jgi:ankyrin repeat protein